MKNLISVIIPVYNIEDYIQECLDSVISQTYNNLEIILIDDESSDDSGKICDEYAKKDGRIKVIHKKNGGAASARNEGLKIATGEYLTFVDSDDYLDNNAYEYMIKQIQEHNADMIQCGLRRVYINQKVDYKSDVLVKKVTEFDVETYLKRYTFDWTCGLIWDKLFRRELFDGIYFETGHKVDDEFFTYQGVMNAKKIICSPEIFYNYRQRKSSVVNEKDSLEKMLFDRLDFLQKRRKNVVSKFPNLKQDFDFHYLDNLIYASKESFVTVDVIKQIQKQIKAYMKNEKHCKMNWKYRLLLLDLEYSNPKKIYRNRNKNEIIKNKYKYFE